MDKKTTQNDELNKSIDTLIDSIFSEKIEKGENFEVANASKTTADAVVNAAPAVQDDASRGAGRPKQISDVPKNDEDGKRDGTYDATIAQVVSEIENEEAKKQAKSIDQTTSAGRLGEGPKMKDPRAGGQIMKSISEQEYAEFESFKKAKADAEEKSKQEELRKSEDLKKAEFEALIKSAINQAIEPVKKENENLKKSLDESQSLIKAMASQPQRSKSVTGIESLEKSNPESTGPQEFSKAEKLDAAERLVVKKSIPMDAVIELENTGTVYNPEYRRLIEAELQKQN
jgi:hypothetical protein